MNNVFRKQILRSLVAVFFLANTVALAQVCGVTQDDGDLRYSCAPTREGSMVNWFAPLSNELEPVVPLPDTDNVRSLPVVPPPSKKKMAMMQFRCMLNKISQNIAENMAGNDNDDTWGTGFTAVFQLPDIRQMIASGAYQVSKGLADAVVCKNEADEAGREEDRFCQGVYRQYARDPMGDAKERCVRENLLSDPGMTKCEAVSYCQGETPSTDKVNLANMLALASEFLGAVAVSAAALAIEGKPPIDVSLVTNIAASVALIASPRSAAISPLRASTEKKLQKLSAAYQSALVSENHELAGRISQKQMSEIQAFYTIAVTTDPGPESKVSLLPRHIPCHIANQAEIVTDSYYYNNRGHDEKFCRLDYLTCQGVSVEKSLAQNYGQRWYCLQVCDDFEGSEFKSRTQVECPSEVVGGKLRRAPEARLYHIEEGLWRLYAALLEAHAQASNKIDVLFNAGTGFGDKNPYTTILNSTVDFTVLNETVPVDVGVFNVKGICGTNLARNIRERLHFSQEYSTFLCDRLFEVVRKYVIDADDTHPLLHDFTCDERGVCSEMACPECTGGKIQLSWEQLSMQQDSLPWFLANVVSDVKFLAKEVQYHEKKWLYQMISRYAEQDQEYIGTVGHVLEIDKNPLDFDERNLFFSDIQQELEES